MSISPSLPGERAHVDEPLVELEEAEEVDEITLEKTPAAQVIEFAAGEAQPAKLGDLAPDLADVRPQVDARGCGT